MTSRKSFDDLIALIAQLRSENGCPWDRAQDHRTLRPYVLEEAHEVIAAIDAEDPSALADELGDLLLQVLLHCRIAAEAGKFSLDEVIDLLAQKLIRRHPHVFGDAADDLQSIERTWAAVKKAEGKVKHRLPAILAARKLVSRPDNEVTLLNREDHPTDEAAAGRQILAAIAAAWNAGIDPEIALLKTISHLEKSMESRSAPIQDAIVYWINTTKDEIHFIDAILSAYDGMANVRRDYQLQNGEIYFKVYVAPGMEQEFLEVIEQLQKTATIGEVSRGEVSRRETSREEVAPQG